MQGRQPVQVFALVTLGTDTAGEEQAEKRPCHFIRACVSTVLGNIASRRRCLLGEVLVLAVTARPLVVPDVKDGTGLRGRFGFDSCWVDLGPGWTALAANYLLFLLSAVCLGDGGF